MRPEEVEVDDLKNKPSKFASTSEEDRVHARLRQKEKDAEHVIRRYNQLLERTALEDAIADEFRASHDQLLQNKRLVINIGPPKVDKRASKKTAESAVLVLSDSHIWKIVKPSTTNGFGNYNPKIFLDRLFYIEQSVARLYRHNIDNPLRKIHVCILGDIVEGALHHAEEIPERGYISDQVLLASYTLYQFLARLSRLVDLEVHCVVGNHGRFQNQRKQPTSGRFSNFDMIAMGQIEHLVRIAGPKNIKFHRNDHSFQYMDVEGWRFKLGHGDHLKGGDKALAIPAHAMAREINATTQRFAARQERPPDFYIVGDKHRHISVGFRVTSSS